MSKATGGYVIKNSSMNVTKAPNQVKSGITKAKIERGGDLRAEATGGKKANGAL